MYLNQCLVALFSIAFMLTKGYASTVDDIHALCDIFNENHPEKWELNPCGWKQPCENALPGVKCSKDLRVIELYMK